MKTLEKFKAMLKVDEKLASEYKKLIDRKDNKKLFTFMQEHGVSDEDIGTLNNLAVIVSNAPTVAEFYSKLASDENLATKYAKVVALDDKQARVEFMKEHGVSDKDMKSLLNRELSDGELNEINGGYQILPATDIERHIETGWIDQEMLLNFRLLYS